ncbi:MAG TPA: hypothetical protein VJH63_02910 [Candidatus Paceibacterota bacterium]
MVAIIIFFVSLLGVVFIFLNKKREIETGRPYLRLVFGSDFHLKRGIESATISVKGMPRRAAQATAFYAVKHGMSAFEKLKALIRPKIAHIIDAVRGKNIPTNKGSVSVFLKNIGEDRDKLK